MSTAFKTTEITECVSLGAEFLDRSDPEWWREDVPRAIDLDTLRLNDSARCVLGQRCPLEVLKDYRNSRHCVLARPYYAYASLLSGTDDGTARDKWAQAHGFMAQAGTAWDGLTEAWSDLITKRRKDAADRGELA